MVPARPALYDRLTGADNLRFMPAVAERRLPIPASIHGLGAGVV